MNRLSDKTNFRITPISSPVCSLCQVSAKAPVLYAVTVGGINSHISHRISFNIYGLSKSGFFIERTSIPEREYLPVYGSDELRIDFSSTKLNIKNEFFRTLKSSTDGKLCVEAIIDGKVYMGDTRILLLPANVYPKNSTPHVFPAFLNPSHGEIERIVSGISAQNKCLSGLYSVLREEKMIYSVRDCDFISRDVAFEDIGSVFSKRSKMLSPLEMSFIFCSCAIRAGLSPVVAVVKKSKAPLIFCGIKTKDADFGIATCSASVFRKLLVEKTVSVFDVSCIFTGHNIDLSDATAVAEQTLLSNDIYYALDVCAAVKNGTDFSLADSSCCENNLRIAQSLRRIEKAKSRSLSEYAEQLTKTDDNPLLDYNFSANINLPVVFSELLSVMAFAEKGIKFPVVSTSEKFDISRITRYGKGICTMLAPSSEFLFTELTHAEHQETAIAIDEYRNIVISNEQSGIISTPLKQHAAMGIVKKLVADDCGENQLFLVCGFLRHEGETSPVALYPVKIFAENGEIRISFDIAKPYVNRLLWEKLKTTPYGQVFFNKYGIPGGSLDRIVSCFESFCTFSHGKAELINECVICSLPYKNTQLSFSIVDRCEKIASDSLVSDILASAGRSVPADIKAFAAKAGEIEKNTVIRTDSDVCISTAIALDSDLAVRGADGIQAYDLSVAVAAENMRCGHTTVIVSKSADVRRDLGSYFEKSGLSFAVLELSTNIDIKKSAAEKLQELSMLETEKEDFPYMSEYDTLRCTLDKRNEGKTRKYDFDFSFADAAVAYVRAGQALSKKEKEILIEPEGIFFPDMSRESSNAVFSAQMNLCRAAGALALSAPYSSHPFYYAKLTEEQPNSVSCKYIADKGICELSELKENCVSICEKCNFDISDIKTFSALHAFLSLAVHVSGAYDKNITDSLLTSDIYSVSKKIASLRETCIKMKQCREFLSDFEDGIFELDADLLISEWTSQQNLSRAEIGRTVLSHKKTDVSIARKDIFEILSQLSLYSTLEKELECDEPEMQSLFAEQYLGEDTDWSQLSRYCDFVKVSDVLLKKMYGTDKEKRDSVSCKLKEIHEFCSDRVNSASIRSAAENFDRMFSQDGGFAALCDKLCVDIYALCFDDGLFSDNGVIGMVKGWSDNVSMLPAVSRYNRCTRECEHLGLSGFVHYLENNSFNRNTESIFTRSLLFLALKQISLYDKGFISASSLEDDIRRFAELHEMRIGFNRNSVKLRHVTQVASYISGNQSVAMAFSESLLDRNFTPEELLLRHGETLKTLFPIIIAEPAACSCLSDYDNVIFLGADTMDSAYAVPVLNIARHRLVVSGICSENRDCFANDIMKTRISHIDLHREESSPFSKSATYSYIRTPVSSYDRERGVNVLEAQTIGLEIIKKLEENCDMSVDILTFTNAQKHVMRDVLAAVSEKSHIVNKAFSEGRITVGYCGQRSTLNSDMAFISTVYGKEENGINLCCEKTDDTAFAYGEYCDKVSNALMGAARSVVVVSSFDSMTAPEKIGSFGHTSIYFLCGFACSGGNMLSADKDEQGKFAYISEFCNLLSDNEIPVSVSNYGNCAIFEIRGKTYTAVFEKGDSFAAYDRECSLGKGENTLILDGAEIILNPQKILDMVTTIGEGC